MLVRLQKLLADSGVASRRASEELIKAGRVEVNGRKVTEMGIKVDALHDRVIVDGRNIRPRRKLYVALHKPRGVVCSRKDPEQRDTAGDLLPAEWGHLYSVGRLDYDSEGLIFFTNDGQFCFQLTHPRHGVIKRYRVTVQGEVTGAHLARMRAGLEHDGEMLRVRSGRILAANRAGSLIELELAEGKNREVRRLFEALGLNVERLQRVQIGPIKLGDLPAGKWRTLSPSEVKSLLTKI